MKMDERCFEKCCVCGIKYPPLTMETLFDQPLKEICCYCMLERSLKIMKNIGETGYDAKIQFGYFYKKVYGE